MKQSCVMPEINYSMFYNLWPERQLAKLISNFKKMLLECKCLEISDRIVLPDSLFSYSRLKTLKIKIKTAHLKIGFNKPILQIDTTILRLLEDSDKINYLQ